MRGVVDYVVVGVFDGDCDEVVGVVAGLVFGEVAGFAAVAYADFGAEGRAGRVAAATPAGGVVFEGD